MSYDASNPKHVIIAGKTAKALDESKKSFIINIMALADGRAYIHDLLVHSHVFAQPFHVEGNPYKTAFGCGQLDVGQYVLRHIMDHCPDDYIRMMREANVRDSTTDARLSRSDEDSRRRDSAEPGPYRHPSEANGDNSPAAADTEYNPIDYAGSEE